MSDREALRSAVEALWDRYEDDAVDPDDPDAVGTLDRLLTALEDGVVRAARPGEDDGHEDDRDAPFEPEWTVEAWVKQGVLLNFALRRTIDHEYGDVIHRDVLGVRSGELGSGARNTPTGTVVRRGGYVGRDAILMSPSFVNAGARVGDGSLVDSNVCVGSCAQVGADVKLGANTLVGGVLEPVEDAPVVVEDGVSLGAGCRVVSGFVVGRDSIVAENTLLSPRIPVYDLPTGEIVYGYLPPGRRAFTRYVESSLSGEGPLGEAYKPAVVALDVEETTLEAVEREGVLRS
jgi:2,3,4,5-tetrahydropyridine-2-carboxylate N-succinyltransferase